MFADCFALGKIIPWRKNSAPLENPTSCWVTHAASATSVSHWLWLMFDSSMPKPPRPPRCFRRWTQTCVVGGKWMNGHWMNLGVSGGLSCFVLGFFLNDEIECITLRLWFCLYDSFNATSLFSDCSYSIEAVGRPNEERCNGKSIHYY